MPKRENEEGAGGVRESCLTDVGLTSGEEREGKKKGWVGKVLYCCGVLRTF